MFSLLARLPVNTSLCSTLISSFSSLQIAARKHTVKTTQVTEKINDELSENVFRNVKNALSTNNNRLFAVVQLCGKQFKITHGDVIVVEGYWPPTSADEICLEKVLLVGGKDFTLLGRPLLDKDTVDVQATVIEKTLSHTKTHFKKKRRKQYTRTNFQRSLLTMVRINSIQAFWKEDRPVSNNKNLF